MTSLWPSGRTPYVTPDQLYAPGANASQWPVGVNWGTIPDSDPGSNITDGQRLAVISMLCQQATALVDQILNQPVRATEMTEEMSAPDFRVTMQWSSGNGRMICARWPVTQVLSVQVSPNATWPRQWTSLPAANFEPEYPVDGLYGASAPSANAGGQAILFAPGYVYWGAGWPGGQVTGRNRFRVSATYISGYPHTSLTASAAAAGTAIAVDDCTGWLLTGSNGGTIGAAGIVYDALGGGQEPVTVTAASATSGPGTLTLSSGLSYSHQSGVMVSAMPESVIYATALLAGQAALTRGATSTTIQTLGGRAAHGGMGPLEARARTLIGAFRRTV